MVENQLRPNKITAGSVLIFDNMPIRLNSILNLFFRIGILSMATKLGNTRSRNSSARGHLV